MNRENLANTTRGIQIIRENFRPMDEKTPQGPSGSEKMLLFCSKLLPAAMVLLYAGFMVFMQRYFSAFLVAFAGVIIQSIKYTDTRKRLIWLTVCFVMLFLIGFDSFLDNSWHYVTGVAMSALGALLVGVIGQSREESAAERAQQEKLWRLSLVLQKKENPNVPIYDVLRKLNDDQLFVRKQEMDLVRARKAGWVTVLLAVLSVFLMVADPHISGTTGYGYQSIRGKQEYKYAGDAVYESSDEGMVLVSWGTCEDVAQIPAQVNGKPVVAIGAQAFWCAPVREVILPDTVKYIRKEAFRGCNSLEKISLPEGLVSINTYAFADCSALKQIILPESLRELHSFAFARSGLTSVNIPSGITEIHAGCFQGCSGLAQVTLPDGLKKISEYVFCNCTSLKLISLPDELSHIGPYAFSGSGLTEVTLPGSIKAIRERCFSDCHYLETVVIGNGISRVGARAFYNCDGLKSVSVPYSMKVFASSCFRDCATLQSVSRPLYVLVNQRAFKNTPAD